MQLEKPKLFGDSKSLIGVMAVLAIALMIHLAFLYQDYRSFIHKPFYFTTAKVLSQSTKNKHGRSYEVLKLHSKEGWTFYTVTYQKKSFQNSQVRLEIFPNVTITFWGYLGTFFVKSRIGQIMPVSQGFKEYLLQEVASQHENKALASFYNAIFFATPLDASLRQKVSMLGISHLVALSGFHLGILWGMIYGIGFWFYRFFQQRYFPYRYALLDVGVVSMAFLAAYLWFVDFPPSLVRSFAMVLTGWFMLLLGMELLSFTFLLTVVAVLMALFPSLMVSLSFWLSVAGVFYIFLVLQYAKSLHKMVITLIVIPLGIFVLMLPIVHAVFGITTAYQLLSPLLSLAFIPFYPAVIFLHLVGMGGLLDSGLAWLFDFPHGGTEYLLPFWALGLYVAMSIGAIWNRWLFGATLGTAMLYALYLFII
ncbi:MAG: ComEC/Rec2 family competence protein [Campylobacterales bacterium]|nr:ComEC/Rec2 family competence protein [Campylobacterales bacterium]